MFTIGVLEEECLISIVVSGVVMTWILIRSELQGSSRIPGLRDQRRE